MTTRKFAMNPAARQRVPVLVGLCGASGSGKTFSALRIATGIARVEQRPIYFIDTEGKRALHYADQHEFTHVPFDPPFSPLDYLDCIEQVAAQRPGCIVIDSMSHEHEGDGGVLAWHDEEVDRLAKDPSDERERGKVTTKAWIKPKAARRQLLQRIIQLDTNMVFCFRAKDKLDFSKGGPPTAMGWQPIAPQEFVYEMTAMALLPPGAQGTPEWQPENAYQQYVKLPNYLSDIFGGGRQLDEKHGEQLARWAMGGAKPDTDFDEAAYQEFRKAAAKDDTIKTLFRDSGTDKATNDALLRRMYTEGWGQDRLRNELAKTSKGDMT